VLLIALATTTALVAAQAARRTDTAFVRDLAHGNSADAFVSANTYSLSTKTSRALLVKGTRLLDTVEKSPLVVGHGRFGGVNLFRIVDGQVDQRLNSGSALGLAAFDAAAGRAVATLRIHSGRPADLERADEVVITPLTATLTGWRVGSHITDLRAFTPDDFDSQTGVPRPEAGTPVPVRVVGIGEFPEDFLAVRSERIPRVFLTPAFARTAHDFVFYLNDGIRLRRGASDLPALRALVAKVQESAPEVSMPIAPVNDGLKAITSANDPLVQGLWAVAVLAALVGLLLVAQSLGQAIAARRDDQAQFRAMGATRRQRLSIELTTVISVAIAAAVLAGVIAYLLSPLTPIGTARDAEPHPGFSFNLALTLVALPITILGTCLAALPALWRLVHDTSLPGPGTLDARERRSRLAELESRSGLGVPAVVGSRFAFQPGRGRTATPVRSVLASLTLVVAAVTGTVAFGANLQHWTTTPHLYGWNWDAAIGSSFGTIPREFETAVQHFENVTEVSALTIGLLTVAGRSIPSIGIDTVVGNVVPEINRGRRATNEREIVLGARTMRELHTHIGGRIDGKVGSKPVHLLVVGTTTFPAFGGQRFGQSGLGTGALGTTALFPFRDDATEGGRYNYMLLRFAPGTASKGSVALRSFMAENGCPDASCLITDSRPAEIDGYRNARGLPVAIGAVLILFLIATLAHALVSTMRRRTNDLAVLRALGSTPRDLSTALRWQGFVLTASALVVGIPAGLIAGRFAWKAFASRIGIATGNSTPIAAFVIGTVALLVVATAVATVVGSRVLPAIRSQRVTAP
jgi:hypothetical protein